MENFNSLSVDNKAVRWAFINGRIVYSVDPDYYTSSLALESFTLSATGIVSSGTYVPPGDTAAYSYSVYGTPAVNFVRQGSGQTNPFAISPHVWCRAKHYASQLTGFTGPDGSAYTVKQQVALTAWALSNDVKLPIEDISDIEMIVTNEAISSQTVLDDIPCIAPLSVFQALLQRDTLSGVAGWTVPQISANPQPIVFSNDTKEGKHYWSTPHMLSSSIPEGEQYDTLRDAPPTYLATGGDSGRPAYLQIGSKKMLVSHNWEVVHPSFGPVAPYYVSGPSYLKAYGVLKAFIEAQGDEATEFDD